MTEPIQDFKVTEITQSEIDASPILRLLYSNGGPRPYLCTFRTSKRPAYVVFWVSAEMSTDASVAWEEIARSMAQDWADAQ